VRLCQTEFDREVCLETKSTASGWADK